MSQERLLQILKASLAAALLGTVGFVDLFTGYEISVFPLYAPPISLAVWFFGVWAGTAALVWIWADIAVGHVDSKPWIVYLNAGSQVVFFLFVALAGGYMVTTLRRARSQSRPFSKTLPICTGCGKVFDRDVYWWNFRGYLREYSCAVTLSKLCADCTHEAYITEEKSATPISR